MSERMTRKRALRVLIDEAAKSVAGTGVGIREAVSEKRTALVVSAIRKLHKEAFGWEVTSSDLINRGIYE